MTFILKQFFLAKTTLILKRREYIELYSCLKWYEGYSM